MIFLNFLILKFYQVNKILKNPFAYENMIIQPGLYTVEFTLLILIIIDKAISPFSALVCTFHLRYFNTKLFSMSYFYEIL